MELLLAQWSFIWIPSVMALLCILIQARARSSRCSRLPPGPRPLPVVGNLFMLGKNPHHSLARLAKTYGPLMSLQLGQITTLVVSSPDMAREVLQKKDQAFGGRSVPDATRVDRYHEASLVWQPVSQPWRKLRKICSTQLFAPRRLDENQGLRLQKARELVTYVRERCQAGEAVDIGRAAFATALNLISTTLFSVDVADPSSDSAQGFRDAISGVLEESGGANLSDFFPLLAVVDVQGRRRRVASHFKHMHGFIDQLIERRLQQGSSTTNDFLDWLIKCQHEEDGLKLHGRALKAFLTDIFIAGSDTISGTVEWAMTELLRNPSSMAKARSELMDAVRAENELEESTILRLPFLQAVVKETLRLHPPAPFLIPHRAEADVELCGYAVPQHARVLVNVWAIGRDSEVWDDPDVFLPERFLERDIDFRGQHFELIPFGSGRRICPGLPIAFRMVHLMLASLLHSFDWQLPEGMAPADVDLTEKFGITLAKAIPLQAIPILEAF